MEVFVLPLEQTRTTHPIWRHSSIPQRVQVLLESTGLSDLSWDDDADAPRCTLLGAAQQVDEAERRLRRAMTHCQWGVSEARHIVGKGRMWGMFWSWSTTKAHVTLQDQQEFSPDQYPWFLLLCS